MARKTLEERALELYEGYRARKDKDAHAQRVINSVLEPNKSYNYNDLRTIDWNSAVDNYYKNNNANSYYLSRSELAGSIQDRINQYNPINDKYFKRATDYLQGGKARRGSGITNFYDYEKAYQEGKTGEELSKIYNEAVGNASKYAQSLWGRDADNALKNYSNKIWDEGGYSEANVDRYRKDLQDTGLFNDATIDALVEQFKFINPRPQVSESDYNQAKSDFDIALEQYVKDTYKNRDLSETNLSDIIKERAQQRNNLIDLYSSKIAPYETKQWSNAGILKAAENVASRANAQENQEESIKLGLIASALEQYGINTRTAADAERDYNYAYNEVQTLTARKEELKKEIKTLANKRQSERMNTGMYASLDSQIQKDSEELTEVTRELYTANNDLEKLENENNNYIALRRSSELDPNGVLSYEQLLKRMEESGESYTIADSMLLADKITTESQIDAEVDRLKALKKNANTQADKDAIDEQIYWIEGQKNVLNVQKKTEEVKKQADYSAEIEGINEDIISKSSIFEHAFAEEGHTGTMMDRVSLQTRMRLMGEQWYNDDYILLFAINGIEDAQNLYDTDIANYGYYETKNVPDDVRNTFNYLFYKNGPEEAKEYWEYFKNSPERKQFVTELMVADAAEFSGEHPFRAWLSDRLTMLPRVGESVVSLVTGNATDPYSSANALSQTVAAHEQGVYDTYGSGWGLLYSGTGSVADMAQAAAIGAGAGKVASLSGASAKTATAVQKAVTTAVQVVPGMATTITEQKKVGASDAQAIAMGIITAAAEILTESYSIDLILKNPASALKRVPRNFFAEGSEEVFSNWFTRIADSIINGDNSEFERTYRQAVLNGSSNSDALSQALLGMMQEDAVSLIVGGVGGSAMGGVFDVASHGTNAYAGKSLSTSEYNTLVKYAENNNKLSGLTDSKSDVAKGRLYYAVQEDIYTQLNKANSVDTLDAVYKNITNGHADDVVGQIAKSIYGDKVLKLTSDTFWKAETTGELKKLYDDAVKKYKEFGIEGRLKSAYENRLSKFDSKSIGAFIRKSEAGVRDLIRSARASGNEQIVQIARNVEEAQTDEGLGELYKKSIEQNNAFDRTEYMRRAISDELNRISNSFNSEESVEKDPIVSNASGIDRATDAIVKRLTGQRLTRSERNIISRSPSAQKIISDYESQNGSVYTSVNNEQLFHDYAQANVSSSSGSASPMLAYSGTYNGQNVDVINLNYDNGQMQFVLNDRSIVPASDVQLDNEADAEVFKAASDLGSTAAGTTFVIGYTSTTQNNNIPIDEYKSAFDTYMNYGRNLVPYDMARQVVEEDAIDPRIARAAYDIGRKEGMQTLSQPGAHLSFTNESAQQKFVRNDGYSATMSVLNQIGKDLGTGIVVTDTMADGELGRFIENAGNDVIVLMYDTDGGMIAKSFGHELFHFIEKYNASGAQELQELVISNLKKDGKYESLHAEAESKYGTDENLDREIAANAMFDVLDNTAFIRNIYERNGETFGEQVRREVNRFTSALKKAVGRLTAIDQTVAALHNDVQTMERIREKFVQAYQTARENKRAGMAETTPDSSALGRTDTLSEETVDGIIKQSDTAVTYSMIRDMFRTRGLQYMPMDVIRKHASEIIDDTGSTYSVDTLTDQLYALLRNATITPARLKTFMTDLTNLVRAVWNQSAATYNIDPTGEFGEYIGKTIYVPNGSVYGTAEQLSERFVNMGFRFTNNKDDADYSINEFASKVGALTEGLVQNNGLSAAQLLENRARLLIDGAPVYGITRLDGERGAEIVDEDSINRAFALLKDLYDSAPTMYQSAKRGNSTAERTQKKLDISNEQLAVMHNQSRADRYEMAQAQKRLDEKEKELSSVKKRVEKIDAMLKSTKDGNKEQLKKRIENDWRKNAINRTVRVAKSLNDRRHIKIKKASDQRRAVPDVLGRSVEKLNNLVEFSAHTDGHRADSAKFSQLKQKMDELLAELNKLRMGYEAGEVDQKFDPPGMLVNPLKDLIDALDPKSENFSYSDVVNSKLKTERRAIINYLSTEDIRLIRDTAVSLRKYINDVNSEFYAGQMSEIQKSWSTMDGYIRKKYSGKSIKVTENRNNKISGVLDVSFLTPVFFFGQFGPEGSRIFNNLSDSQANVYFDIKQIRDDFIRMMENHFGGRTVKKDGTETAVDTNAISRAQDELNFAKTVKIGNRSVVLSKAYIMDLYMMFRREAAADKIKAIVIRKQESNGWLRDMQRWIMGDGGQTYKIDAQGYGDGANGPIAVTKEDVRKLVDQELSQQEKEFAEELQSYMSVVGGEWGNEASRSMYGITAFGEDTYTPLSRYQAETNGKVPDPQLGTQQIDDANMFSVENSSFTKSLTNGSGTYYVGSAMDVFVDHMLRMALYRNMAPELRKLRQIYQAKNEDGKRYIEIIKNYLPGSSNNNAETYMRALLNDLNNAGWYVDRFTKGDTEFIRKVSRNAKISMVGLSLWTGIKQPLSILKAGYVLDDDLIVKAAAADRYLKNLDEAKKYNGLALRKSEFGGYTTGTSRSVRDAILKVTKKESIMDKLMDASGLFSEFMDNNSWGLLWNASRMQVERDRPNLTKGSDAYYKAIADKFSEVVNKTQVVDTPLNRSQIRRNQNPVLEPFTMFQDEGIVTYNILHAITTDLDYGKYSGTKNAKAKAIAHWIVTFALGKAIESLINALNRTLGDDDRTDSFLDGYLDNFIEDISSNWIIDLPFLNQLVDGISGYLGTSNNLALFEQLGNFVRNGISISKKLSDGEDITVSQVFKGPAIDALTETVSYMSGIPVTRVKDEVLKVVDLLSIQFTGLPWGETMDSARVVDAIEKGNFGTAKRRIEEIIADNESQQNKYLKQSKKDVCGNIRSAITRSVKDKYVDYIVSGKTEEAETLRDNLIRLDIGYKRSDFNDWVKERRDKEKEQELIKQEEERIKSEGK